MNAGINVGWQAKPLIWFKIIKIILSGKNVNNGKVM